MELLCSTYDICYLPMDFIPRLKQHGWTEVKRFFVQHNRYNKGRSICRPNLQTEPTIIIPAFLHNSHWAGLVRRIINGVVNFFYSDDMNNCNDEQNIRTLIRTQTCKEFCPDSAIWVNCASNFYINHSNECGPRTILACHIMATHPFPFKEMLLPIMHSNLAQITRTWIASTLIGGKILHHTLDTVYSINQYPDTRSSYKTTSFPFNIIPWTIPPKTPTYTIPSPSHTQLMDETTNSSEEVNIEPFTPLLTDNNIPILSRPCKNTNKEHETSISIGNENDPPTHLATTKTSSNIKQTKISNWTARRDFPNETLPPITLCLLEPHHTHILTKQIGLVSSCKTRSMPFNLQMMIITDNTRSQT
jgi:hypothetical protein